MAAVPSAALKRPARIQWRVMCFSPVVACNLARTARDVACICGYFTVSMSHLLGEADLTVSTHAVQAAHTMSSVPNGVVANFVAALGDNFALWASLAAALGFTLLAVYPIQMFLRHGWPIKR